MCVCVCLYYRCPTSHTHALLLLPASSLYFFNNGFIKFGLSKEKSSAPVCSAADAEQHLLMLESENTKVNKVPMYLGGFWGLLTGAFTRISPVQSFQISVCFTENTAKQCQRHTFLPTFSPNLSFLFICER